jgi:hypothetical protein
MVRESFVGNKPINLIAKIDHYVVTNAAGFSFWGSSPTAKYGLLYFSPDAGRTSKKDSTV